MIRNVLQTGVLTASLAAACVAQVVEIKSNLINDVDQATVAMHPATPYIERSTALLVDVNLEKIDVEATSRWLDEMLGGKKDDSTVVTARGFIDSLKGAGVSHLFVTAATQSATDGGPIVIIPCENSAVVNGLVTVIMQKFPKQSAQKIHITGDKVLAGAARAIDRVTSDPSVERPDLILPLGHADRLDHTMVIALPEQSRSDLVELWPDRLPENSPIQCSPRAMAQDILRIVVSLRLPPDPLMVIHVESPDASAADRVKKVVEQIIALGGDVKSSIEIKRNVATLELRASPEAFAEIAKAIASPQRQQATQMMTSNHLKQVGLAIHNYYATEQHLPPLYFTDREGRPLLSWRVALLPYIDQQAMYRSLRLDEPWNSETNQPFSSTLIPVYCDDSKRGAKTTIRVPVYPGSAWYGDGPPKDFRDIKDGTSNTIAAIDAPDNAAIEWANPEPWRLSIEDPMSDVFAERETATIVLFDGAALVLKKSEMTNDKLKAMLTIDGGERIEDLR